MPIMVKAINLESFSRSLEQHFFLSQKFRVFFKTKYEFTSSRNSLLQSHLKSLTIRGSRHKLWNCAIWHCSTVSLRNSLDFRSTLDTEAAYSEANRLVTIDTTKVTKVVYMSSKILHLTVGSGDASQDDKKQDRRYSDKKICQKYSSKKIYQKIHQKNCLKFHQKNRL